MWWIVLIQATQITADGAAWEQLKARIEVAPRDVATFIERRTGCNYLAGEVGSDFAERERWLEGQQKKLRCDEIGANEQALEKKYRKNPDVAQLLQDTKDLLPW